MATGKSDADMEELINEDLHAETMAVDASAELCADAAESAENEGPKGEALATGKSDTDMEELINEDLHTETMAVDASAELCADAAASAENEGPKREALDLENIPAEIELDAAEHIRHVPMIVDGCPGLDLDTCRLLLPASATAKVHVEMVDSSRIPLCRSQAFAESCVTKSWADALATGRPWCQTCFGKLNGHSKKIVVEALEEQAKKLPNP